MERLSGQKKIKDDAIININICLCHAIFLQ